jgi:hypothetical protein
MSTLNSNTELVKFGKRMYLKAFKPSYWLISFLIPILLVSCHVMLAGAYNEKVDEGIQKVSDDVSTLMVTLESNIDNNQLKDNKYEKFQPSYITIFSTLESLKIRTQSLPKYEQVTKMITALTQNLKDFESLHKTGFNNKRMLMTARSLIETSLVNVLASQNALKR